MTSFLCIKCSDPLCLYLFDTDIVCNMTHIVLFFSQVTAFSLMCASDNIAVYMSLFVGMRLWEIVLTTSLYYLLLLISMMLASLFIQVINIDLSDFCL